MTSLLSEELGAYLDGLRAAFPAIEEVWLIGSRANHTAHAGSDWDFIAFADQAACDEIEVDAQWHRADVDLLVVVDGNEFKRPWGNPQAGTLEAWAWKRAGPTAATYIGSTWSDDEDAWVEQKFNAVRVR